MSRAAALSCALILAVGACVYLATLDRHGFWSDETKTVGGSRLPYSEMVPERLVNGHHPLYHSVAWVMVRVAHESEFWLRLPAALAGVASAGVLAALLARAGHPWLGVLAALLLLVNSAQLRVSQVARPYSTVELLTLLSTYVIARDGGRNEPRNAMAFGALCAMNLYTHFSAGILVATQAVYLLVRRPLAWRFLVGVGVALALYAPSVWWFTAQTSMEARIGWVERMEPSPDSMFFNFFTRGLGAAPHSRVVACVALGLGLLGALRLGRTGRLLATMWLVPLALTFALAPFGVPPVQRIARYFSTTPALQTALVVGSLAGGPRAVRAVAGALIAAGGVYLCMGTAHYLEKGVYPGWRQGIAEVSSRKDESEAVVMHQGRRDVEWRTFSHYYDGPFFDLRAPSAPPRTREDLHPEPLESGDPERLALPPGTTGVWIVTPNAKTLSDVERDTLDDLRERFPRSETTKLRRISVIHRWKEP